MDFIVGGIVKAFHLLLAGDQETYSAVKATIYVSSLSMLASLVLGIPSGFALGYFSFPGKKALRMVVDTLMALPTVFIGLVVYALISSRGPLGSLGILFSLPGIALGQAILALPVVAALSAMSVESLDSRIRHTLMSFGVSRTRLFFTTIREVRFGLLIAALNAYGRVTTEVGISMMVGGNIKWHTRTITTAIALETGKGMFDTGIALGLILLMIAFAVNLSLSFLRKYE